MNLPQPIMQESPPRLLNDYKKITEGVVETALCALDPRYFLTKYAVIQDRNTAQVVKWQPWQYQLDLLTLFQIYPEIVIAKARQLGITWLVTGYGLWKALFSPSAKILYMSAKEDLAWQLVSKSSFIRDNLPPYLRRPSMHTGKAYVDFAGNSSEIQALASVAGAGRGTDATLIVRDELRDHPEGKANFLAVSPAIDAGGQLIDLSTYNKYDLENHFSERVASFLTESTRIDYKSGIVVFEKQRVVGDKIRKSCLVFLGWNIRPIREQGLTNDEWFQLKVIPRYSESDREQEYPLTIEEMLRQPKTRQFFDIDALNEIELLGRPAPLSKVDDIDTRNGIIKIWVKPIVGRKYICFTDPSNGIEDPFASVVIDWQTGEQVAGAGAKITAKDVAVIHDSLVRYYNNAFNTGETNAQAGGAFIDAIKDLNTPNLAPRRSPDGKIIPGKIGWYTTEPLKDRMLNDYREGIRKRLVIVHDKEALSQHRQFVQPEGETKPRSVHGTHDDWIMAFAGAYYLKRLFVPQDAYKITSVKYRG